MGCLDENAILELLEGAADETRASELLAHLDACPECRRLLSEAARAGAEDPPKRAAVDLEHLVGRRLGNFEVTAFLGAGAMGSVFAGRHVMLGHAVAIKLMLADDPDPALQAQAAERFITEARALTEIRDPHVIQLHDFGQLEEGCFYYVMERLEGQTLEQELRARGRFTPEQALPYLQQICAGLSAAHRSGILHRDLKPQNIFVLGSDPPQLKLIDFGLAKRLGHPSATVGGMGSPIYAAPELVLGEREKIGPQSDLYSVGMILYRMLSGAFPFDLPAEATPLELFLLPTRTDPLPLRDRAPGTPIAIAELVDDCLRRNPAARPATAASLCQAFERASGAPATAIGTAATIPAAPPPLGESATAPDLPAALRAVRPRPEPDRRRRRWWIGIAIAGLAGLALLLGVGLRERGARDRGDRPGTPARSGAPAALWVESDDLLRATSAEVFVSSQIRNRSDQLGHLVDNRLDTAWNSRSGDLEGAWIAFRVPATVRVEAILLTVGFSSGDGKKDLFLMNHRITRVRLLRDGKLLGEHALDIAERGLQRIPVGGPGGDYRIEVLALAPGSKRTWRETCVSELRVLGKLPRALRPGTSPPVVRVGHDLRQAVALLEGDSVGVAAVAPLARRLRAELGERARRPLASAINTRGHRLYRQAELQEALSLFDAAAALDPSYGMPRYNSARIHALRGELAECVRRLEELKQLGPSQRKRLEAAQSDEAFRPVWEDLGFKALFR